jgi:hypothetical protein
MNFTIETIIFFVLLLDSIIANLIAYFGRRWYMEHFQLLSRWVPITRVWASGYLLLVVWIGTILYRVGAF